MATYRFGFYGLDELVLGDGSEPAAFQLAARPDAWLRLSGPRPVLTPVRVATPDTREAAGLLAPDGPGAWIASGSGFGSEGQQVGLADRLHLAGDDGISQGLTVDVLEVAGRPVGLVASAPLRPGVTYRVIGRAASDHAGDPVSRLGALDPTLTAENALLSAEMVFSFTHGTTLDTPDGPRRVEDLNPGDLVTTLGNGSQRLRWTGNRHVSVAELLMFPGFQPVEFAAGAIGNPGPLRVSPRHRILLNDWRAQVFFGEDEVLIPAQALVNGRTIRQVLPAEGVTYAHLLFDRHEIIVSDGALSESFHPGEAGLLALDEAQRHEVERLFPPQDLSRRRAAFPIVTLSEARALRLPD